MGKMKNPNISTMLVVCSHRSLSIDTFQSFTRLLTTVPQGHSLTMSIGLEPSIAKSRSFWATIFLDKSKCDVLAFIDDDIEFDAKDFWKIVDRAYNEKCVVGGVYMMRKFPPVAVVSVKDSFMFNGEVREVDGLGTGFIAIHRDVMTAVASKGEKVECGKMYEGKPFRVYYPTFAEIVRNGVWESEDYGFCNLARENGFKILADTSIFLKHIGVYGYSPLDLNIKWPEASPQ